VAAPQAERAFACRGSRGTSRRPISTGLQAAAKRLAEPTLDKRFRGLRSKPLEVPFAIDRNGDPWATLPFTSRASGGIGQDAQDFRFPVPAKGVWGFQVPPSRHVSAPGKTSLGALGRCSLNPATRRSRSLPKRAWPPRGRANPGVVPSRGPSRNNRLRCASADGWGAIVGSAASFGRRNLIGHASMSAPTRAGQGSTAMRSRKLRVVPRSSAVCSTARSGAVVVLPCRSRATRPDERDPKISRRNSHGASVLPRAWSPYCERGAQRSNSSGRPTPSAEVLPELALRRP